MGQLRGLQLFIISTHSALDRHEPLIALSDQVAIYDLDINWRLGRSLGGY